MSLSVKNNLHRSAVALNNIGVSFLSRGYYCNALDTFTKAFHLMECLNDMEEKSNNRNDNDTNNNSNDSNHHDNDDDDSNHDAPEPCHLDNTFLQVASQKLVRSKSRRTNNDNVDDNTKFAIRITDLDTFKDFDALQDVVDVVSTTTTTTTTNTTASASSCTVGYAVRIDVFDLDFCDDYNSGKFQTDCAIILLNLGTACLLYGFANVSSVVGHKFKNDTTIYEKGLSLCQGAYEILTSIQWMDNEIFETKRAEVLTIMILQTLVRTATEMNHSGQVKHYSIELGTIQNKIISKNQIMNPYLDFVYTHAAAAQA